MKKAAMAALTVILTLVVASVFVPIGPAGSSTPPDECPPTSYSVLLDRAQVWGGVRVDLFELRDIDTSCFKEIRLFVHVWNEDYRRNPFRRGARISISGFHNTPGGSWTYFTEDFPMSVTSYIDGVAYIPVVGDRFRVVGWGFNLPNVLLEVTVTAYLVR